MQCESVPCTDDVKKIKSKSDTALERWLLSKLKNSLALFNSQCIKGLPLTTHPFSCGSAYENGCVVNGMCAIYSSRLSINDIKLSSHIQVSQTKVTIVFTDKINYKRTILFKTTMYDIVLFQYSSQP